VPRTLLAVDDSVTMRKVLEITFSGEDFKVVAADGKAAAMTALGSEKPHAVVIDTVLGADDGYALCKEVRAAAPGAAILLLASRYNPYDPQKGKDAGADDFADKPFDTQQLIDKVKKILLTKEGPGAQPTAAPVAAAAAPAPAPAPVAAPAPMAAPAPVAAAAKPAAPASPASPAAAAKPGPRSPTLMFGQEPPKAPSVPGPAFKTEKTDVASPAVSAVASAVNGHLATKLSDMGLSPQQADAVLALSREVVERVVWEVVPQLAEVLIKEEIARLTKD